MKLLIWTLTLLAATSGAAHAGPVAGFVAAVSGWFATTFGAAVGGFLFNTISSLALSALSMALRGKPEVRQPGITTDTTTAGGTIPQRLIFGRYATAGQMVAPMMVYQTDGNPNEWLVYVISLADKPVTGLGRLFIDGRPQTIDGNPAASAHADTMGATMLGDGDGDDSLRDKVYIRFHNGRQTTPDAYLRRVFGAYPERPWTADMIGTGVAYVVVTFKGKSQDGDYSGFPSIKFEVDGHALYDPRDATQSATNEATWKFTRNPAIIAYNILRGISIPGGSTWGVGARRFVQSYVIAAANICDQVISAPGGGTRVRYQAGLEVSVADEPHQALTEITKAMAGEVADMGGTWLLSAGDPGGSVLSITDDDIIVTDSRNLRPYPGLDETVNAIHASYPDPAQQWEAKEAVPLYNAAYEAADGGRRLVAEVDFPAVPYPVQVRALMREMLADHRRMRTHVITLPPDALGLLLGDHIAWTSAVNGYIGKLFKVLSKRVDPQSLCVALTITERDPSDYDYDAESDGDLPTLPSDKPVRPVIEGITGWTVTAVNAGGRPGIRMGWNSEINARAVSWTIRLAADNSMVNSGSTADLARGNVTVTAGLKPSTDYRVTGKLVLPRRTTETSVTTVTTLALGLTDDDFVGGIKKLFSDQGLYAIEYFDTLPQTGNFVGRLVFLTTDGKLYRWTGSAWVEAVSATLDRLLTETDFAQGITIPRIYSTLPTTGNYIGRLAVLSSDRRLYRWNGTAWTAEVAADLITGKLTAGQIAAGAIGVDQLAAGAVVTSKLAVTDWTNHVPDDQIQDLDAWTIYAPDGNVTHAPNRRASTNPVLRSAGAFVISPSSTGQVDIYSRKFPVKPGENFRFSFQSGGFGGAFGYSAAFALQYFDASDAYLASSALLTNSTKDTMGEAAGDTEVPAGAVMARLLFRVLAGEYGGNTIVIGGPRILRKATGELVVDGTITGNKIVANTITGGLLATAGIITTAAQITNGLIVNAHIENLTVGPEKIQVDGLSKLWNADFADTATNQNDALWTEVGRLTLTPYATGTKLLVTGGGELYARSSINGAKSVQMRVLINGVSAFSRTIRSIIAGGDPNITNSNTDWVSIIAVRRTVAGTNTVVLQVRQLQDDSSQPAHGAFNAGSLYAVEFKK